MDKRKRQLIKSTIKERFYRRLLNLTTWQLTEAGWDMMLGDDDPDDYGGDDPIQPCPCPFPTGIIFAELSY